MDTWGNSGVGGEFPGAFKEAGWFGLFASKRLTVRVGRDRNIQYIIITVSPNCTNLPYSAYQHCLLAWLQPCVFEARGETFPSRTAHAWTDRSSSQWLRIPCSVAEGRAVQLFCCDLGVFLLPRLWSADCAKVSLLHARPNASKQAQARLGSSSEELHIVGAREGVYSSLLCTVYRTRIGLSCGNLSTVLSGFLGC